MRSYKPVCALLLLLTLAVLPGCGGDDSDAGGSQRVVAKVLEEVQRGIPADPGQWIVEIETDPDGKPAYTVKEVIVPPGNTDFLLKNPQSTGHDLTIRQVGAGRVATNIVRDSYEWVRISLFEGEKYVFYCSVPGHRKAGMEGVIRVDPKLEAADLEAF